MMMMPDEELEADAGDEHREDKLVEAMAGAAEVEQELPVR